MKKTKKEKKKSEIVDINDLSEPVISEPEPEQPKVEESKEPKQEPKKKTEKKPEKPVSNPKEKEKAPTTPKKEEPIIISTADYNKQLEEKRKAKEQEKANKLRLGIAPF